MASISERRTVPSAKRDRLSAPSDLEKQFRDLRRLRKLVNDLERQGQQNVGDGRCNTNEERHKE